MAFGSSGSKQSNSSNTNQTQTVTPTNPAWVDSGLAGIGSTLSGLAGADPYSFTAGPAQLQTQAADAAGGLGAGVPQATQTGQSDLANATGITNWMANAKAPQMTAATASPFIQSYMNPYMNDVVNSSLAGFDNNAGYQIAQNQLGLANDSTFGGSGGAIQSALLQSRQGLDRAQLQSGLLSQGFDTALGAAQSDADRAQQASATNAQLHSTMQDRRLAAAAQLGQLGQAGQQLALNGDANSRSNITTQGSLGDMLRQIQLQQNQAPLSLAGDLSQIWGNLPLDLLHGQNGALQGTTTGSGTSIGAKASFG